MKYEPVQAALRAYTKPPDTPKADKPPDDKGRARRPPHIKHILVYDTETETKLGQRLTFGAFAIYKVAPRSYRLTCIQRGLIHADDLASRDPRGMRTLREYVRRHRTDAAPDPGLDSSLALALLSRAQFVRLLYRWAYPPLPEHIENAKPTGDDKDAHRAWREKASRWQSREAACIVGFNLPFDISRIALKWGEGRRSWRGAFVFTLKQYRDRKTGKMKPDGFRPPIRVHHIDSTRARFRFAGTRGGSRFPGQFVDLRTLAFSLTSEKLSLQSACEAFGVAGKQPTDEHGRITAEYIGYCLEDIAATARLYTACLLELAKHPVNLPATAAASPASLSKAYRDAWGIPPLSDRSDIADHVNAAAMQSFYGARVEAHVRRSVVPVAWADFRSQYPTVCALMDYRRFMVAEKITAVDATAQARRLLRDITLDGLLKQETWRDLPMIVQIEPDGEQLPARAFYSNNNQPNIGVNPLRSTEPLWYTLADAYAAKLLTGRAPHICAAWRFEAEGEAGVTPVAIRGEAPTDPACRDPFLSMIELREQVRDNKRLSQALKIIANAGCYGVYAQVDKDESAPPAPQTVYGLHDWFQTTDAHVPEKLGRHAHAPLATCITGAARLLLAMLQTMAVEEGGRVVYMDTDSAAFAATETGGLVPCEGGPATDSEGRACLPALSWEQVENIKQRIQALSPYDDGVELLKTENDSLTRQLYIDAASPKRYVRFNMDADGAPVIVKQSDHGVAVLDPSSLGRASDNSRLWIRETWERTIAEDLGLPAPAAPDYHELMCMLPHTLSTPALAKLIHRDYKKRRGQNDWPGAPSTPAVSWPFNFMMTASAAANVNAGDRVVPLLPRENDPDRWPQLKAINKQTGERVELTTESHGVVREDIEASRVRIKTIGELAGEYVTNPDATHLAPDGGPCKRDTRGLLKPRPVSFVAVRFVGKEGGLVEEVTAGQIIDPTEQQNLFTDPDDAVVEGFVRRVLSSLPDTDAQIAKQTGLSAQTVGAVRRGRARPSAITRAALQKYAVNHTRAALRKSGIPLLKASDVQILVEYLERGERWRCAWADCKKSMRGKRRGSRYCSDAHSEAARRQQKAEARR